LPVGRALISVSDKSGLIELARGLVDAGVEIISSGGTASALAAAGVPVLEVANVTGAAEMLDGRVKTLHPAIHGGILADRRKQDHMRQLDDAGIAPIDLVVVNLYPFEETAAAPDVPEDDAVEQIDIGGPALTRAAAKNFHSVAVVVDPRRYGEVLEHVRATREIPQDLRRRLALEAFQHTAAYDAAISTFLGPAQEWPQRMLRAYDKALELRYGENPHQSAAFYRSSGEPAGLAAMQQLHGKELSFNNLLDTDAAYKLVSELEGFGVAIIKHSNPCGVAVANSIQDAYKRAYECDTTSAFGGIVALNSLCTQGAAEAIAQIFTEVVIAPGYEGPALDALRAKKNLRILRAPLFGPSQLDLRSVTGGLLVQSPDPLDNAAEATVVTKAEPTPEQWADLRFAWIVVKHVKSNAIVLAARGTALGVGAGQMSRVEATELAARRAGDKAKGTVCASDAFFPFRDGLDAAVEAGAVAFIQPGGSVRDDEVIAAADEHGIPMVFTGRRHFRH
jgi:phosphoribosylaminoimidazolecarboxamide formyltransferase / IMP cyclohydrolase